MNTQIVPPLISSKYRNLDKHINNVVENKLQNKDNKIRLTLTEGSNICSRFCATGTAVDEEIIEYLERSIEYIPIKYPVDILVSSTKKGSEVIEKLKELVKNDAYARLLAANHDLKRNILISLVLAVFGLLMLGLQAFLSNPVNIPMSDQFLLIISWVFIWKAVETYLFDRPKKKLAYLKLMQLYLAEYREENSTL
jgi:hypothetical protein